MGRRTTRRAVLGIDAAWTERNPSGMALVVEDGRAWRCVHVAPSYAAFLGEADAGSHRFPGAAPLLRRAAALLPERARIAAVAVDMPLARGRISARRECDNAISRQFGASGCSVHSPLPDRPGPLAEAIRRSFEAEGFELATAGRARDGQRLVEVYPHVALLALTGATKRLHYKFARMRKYWPELGQEARVTNLMEVWRGILRHTGRVIEDVLLPLPPPLPRLGLKSFEDMLDALICAWVATLILEDAAVPIGDDFAAIWIPNRFAG